MITATAFVVCAAATAVLRLAISAPLNIRWSLPLGTLLVNVTGSLAMGLLAGAVPPVLTALGVGAVGTYTTFSTFAVEATTLARRAPLLAGTYVALSAIGCTVAAWVGLLASG